MQNAKLLLRFLRYLLRSNSKFGVHSPFLYQLITEVFEDKTIYPAYQEVESLKAALLKNEQQIEVIDHGAGSRVDKGNLRSISRITKNTSKPTKYGRLLYRLVQYLKPDNVIELGTSMGLSAAYMAFARPESKIITIEGSPNIAKVAKKNFDDLNLPNVQLNQGTFDEILPKILRETGKTDFVFIDGNHRKAPTLNYFEQCLSRAVNDTCLVFDDIHWSEGMESAWEVIKHNRKVTLSVDLFFMGIIFFKEELTKQDFVIRF